MRLCHFFRGGGRRRGRQNFLFTFVVPIPERFWRNSLRSPKLDLWPYCAQKNFPQDAQCIKFVG